MEKTRPASWPVRAQAALLLRQRQQAKRREAAEGQAQLEAPQQWEAWLQAVLPLYFGSFAERHRAFWSWVWSIQPGEAVRPLLAIWPRGGGKSTGAEAAVVAVGAPRCRKPLRKDKAAASGERAARRYVVYVRETQAQANKSVGNVAEMLESASMALY